MASFNLPPVLRTVPAWVWALLVVAHALVFGYAVRSGHYIFHDSGRYLQAARNLRAHSQLYARPWPSQPPQGAAVQEFTIRPPGYPLVIMGLGGATGRPVLLLLFQNALSLVVLATVLGEAAATRVRPPSRRWWVAAVALTLSFPAQLIYANAVMTEIPLQAVIMLGAGLGMKYAATHRARYLAGAAGALVAAWLLKPVWYPFSLVFLVVAGWEAWRRRRPLLALLGALPLLLALAYMGWNWQRTGYFHFSSIADTNLLHYNAAGVVRQTQGPASEDAWLDAVLRQADAQPTFAARQYTVQAAAAAVLQQHPWRYAGQHIAGMATLFLDPGRYDFSTFWGLPDHVGLLSQLRSGGWPGIWGGLRQQPLGLLLVLGLVAGANLLRLLLAGRGLARTTEDALLGSWLRLATPVGRWVAVGLLLYVALLTGPLGAARFLVPVWPLWLGLALRGVSTNHDSATKPGI